MADYTNNEQVKIEQEEAGIFDLANIWRIVMLHWPWIILSVIICVGCAYAYLRYKTTTIYSASTKVLVKDDDNSRRRPMSANAMSLSDMGIISNSNGFDNELEILTSTAIASDAVKELKLYTTYFIEGRIRTAELYKTSPVLVDMEEEDLNELESPIRMQISFKGSGIRVTAEQAQGNGIKTLCKSKDITKLPAVIKTEAGTLIFSKNEAEECTKANDIFVFLNPVKAVASSYAKRLNAQATSKTTTVAQISINDNEVERAMDYLKQLIISYNKDANEDKNEVAEKTRVFIDERIAAIGDELDDTEEELEGYKKQNELINLANDATNSLTSTTQFQKDQVEIETEITLIKALMEYVGNKENDFQIIPSNLGLKDQALNTQIKAHNEAVLQYNKLKRTGAESNPALTKLTNDIEDMHEAVSQSLNSVYANLLIQKKSIDKQYQMFAGRVHSTPTHERTLGGIGRQQEIKAGLYLMLLQKREENFISLASTATKAKVIDEPQYTGIVSPRKNIILLIALVLGLCIPIGIFYLLELMRFRIEGRNDVEKLTQLPIISDVPFSHTKKGEKERAIVVSENSNNSMEETFRGLRTNLRFIMTEEEKVILCTSTIPGEGKTFIASNLAMSFALLGKKVLLVGLDIRKPRLVNLFELHSDKRGITEFLRTESAGFDLLEEQIHKGIINQNLDILPAGIIPPNPGELISRKRLDEAISHLRTIYDIIIIDTPPVGLVSDTLEIGRVADVSIYVCRADYSPKANFELINSIQADGKLPKLNLVLNGVDLKKKKYGYYYGYSKYGRYGYGKYGKYGYGKYGRYGHYGHYGHYGVYGSYSSDDKGKGKLHTEK